MKAAQMTREDEIRSISQKYEMDKEKVRDILERGVRYADTDKAALFACIDGKRILRKYWRSAGKSPGAVCRSGLGITGDRYDEKILSATVPAGCIVSMAWKKTVRLTP